MALLNCNMDAEKGICKYLFLPLQKSILYSQLWPVLCSSYEGLNSTKVMIGFVGLLLGLYTYQQLRRKKGLPPGPFCFPIVGWIGDVRNISATAIKMQKQYGDIFRIKIGVHDFVFLTSYSLIKLALNDKNLQGRTNFFTFKSVTFDKNIGLINSEGEEWRIARKFAMRRLGSLGLNNSNMQQYIQHEATKLVEYFTSLDGKPVVLGPVVNVAVLNVIWRLVADRRYDINDPEIKEFVKLLEEVVTIFEGPINVLNFLPWMKHCAPKFLLKWLGVDSLLEGRDKIYKFTMREIERHERKFNPEDPKDYIDHYLKQMSLESDDPSSHFSPDKMDLSASIIDLFFAGSETTSSTLKWFLLFMAKNQEIQNRIRKDLDEVVPRPLLPSLEDKERLTYLQAAIMETLRLSSFVPQGLPHVATADTTVAGYSIPKGTIVSPCFEVCHKNPIYWERPTQFYPEHFLDDKGRIISKEGYMPFSLGPRRCLGESLAKMELFLMSAIILQQFTVHPGPTVAKIISNNRMTTKLFNTPPDDSIILTKRS